MVQVQQINLNHCEVAQKLQPQLIQEEAAYITIVCEQFRDLNDPNWLRVTKSKAVIWVSENLQISRKMVTPFLPLCECK